MNLKIPKVTPNFPLTRIMLTVLESLNFNAFHFDVEDVQFNFKNLIFIVA